MSQPIERTLRPETINEILLINRINELHRLAHLNYASPLGYFDATDPNDREVTVTHMAPSLRMAAMVSSKYADPYTLRVTARSFGPDKGSISHAYYVTEQQLAQLGPGEAATMIQELHKKTYRELVKHLENDVIAKGERLFGRSYSG